MESLQFETLEQSLSPTLQNLELKRRELKKEGQSAGMWVGGFLLVIGVGLSLYFNIGLIGICVTTGIALCVYCACVNTKSQELSAYYKKEVVAQALQSFCENATFTPEQGISEGAFRSCGLFTSPNRYHTEDLIQGCVGKTAFRCAEVHAEERKTRVNGKGQTSHYWVDIFKGFVFIADFQKDFHGHTTVLRDRLFKLNLDGSRVKLENPDFEKTFDVFSTDQVEARYLLSLSMMERLLALERQLNKGITVSFRNSNILIAIPESKNHFEASIWKSIRNLSQFKNDISTIHALISIVEDLNLNTRIWTKE